ncbi:MAG: hypothetical protein IPJ03_08490 [Ignavibacteriales bacterium]|nr:hypothetical protein [Ignavibacteriales bacterium]
MKTFYKTFAIILVTFLLLEGKSLAQNNEQPMLIVSSQKVKMGDMAAANKMITEKFAAILNSFVDSKMLLSWGQFNHAWGDEWNFNIWYIAKDMNAFDKFWEEYINQINEKQPDAFKQLRELFQEHKDNIYTIMYQYPDSPQK